MNTVLHIELTNKQRNYLKKVKNKIKNSLSYRNNDWVDHMNPNIVVDRILTNNSYTKDDRVLLNGLNEKYRVIDITKPKAKKIYVVGNVEYTTLLAAKFAQERTGEPISYH